MADANAVNAGTWVIGNGTKLGYQLWNGLELEEADFFFVTNLMVVGGLASIDYVLAIEEYRVLCSEAPSPSKFSLKLALQSIVKQSPKFDTRILDCLSEAVICLQKKSQSMSYAARNGHKVAATFLLQNMDDKNPKILSNGLTPLFTAIMHGHQAVATALLEMGSDPNTEDNEGRTPLLRMATKGDEKMVNILLKNGANPSDESSFGMSPVSEAAAKGHEAIVKLLLERGVDPNARDRYGDSILPNAAASHHTKVVKLLLDWDADPNTMDDKNRTPLYWAVWHEDEEMMKILPQKGTIAFNFGPQLLSHAAERGFAEGVRFLLEGRAYPDFKDSCGRSALSWAVTRGQSLRNWNWYNFNKNNLDKKEFKHVVRLLLEAGAGPDESFTGRTPLSFAAAVDLSSDCEQIIQLLLGSEKVDPNPKDYSGRSPLSWAASIDNEKVVRMLLEKGADPDSRDNNGKTPLSWTTARLTVAYNTAKLLLKWGADPDSRDIDGCTPLIWAEQRVVDEMYDDGDYASDKKAESSESAEEICRKRLLKSLLDKDANPHPKDRSGRTLLSWTAETGSIKRTTILLEKGADPNLKDNKGQTPLHFAADRGYARVAQLLLENGADPDPEDDYGQTLLLRAARSLSEEVIKLLLEKQVDVNHKDKDGNTLLLASLHDELTWDGGIVTSLLSKGADPNCQNKLGETPLYLAEAKEDEGDALELLLERGANPASINALGGKALLPAVKNCCYATVDLLLKWGADHHLKDDCGRTLLSLAVMNRCNDIIMVLLENGADPNFKGDDGRTSLSYGPASDTTKQLLEWGANPSLKDKSGRISLSWTAELGGADEVGLLLETGADPNSKNHNGRTPLSWTASSGLRAMKSLKALLERRADVDFRDNDGRTPLSWAAAGGF